MNKKTKIFYIFLTLFVIFFVWESLSLIINEEMILPSPFVVLVKSFSVITSKNFLSSFCMTFFRCLISFALSFVIAMVFALLSKKSEKAKIMIEPIITIIRSLPTLAVILILLIWTSSKVAPIIVTMLVVLPTLYTNIYENLSEINPELIEMCKFYKLSQKQIIFKFELPVILPPMLLTIGSGIALNLKLMVAAEVIVQTSNSLGMIMYNYQNHILTANVMAVVLVIVMTGLLIEQIFRIL